MKRNSTGAMIAKRDKNPPRSSGSRSCQRLEMKLSLFDQVVYIGDQVHWIWSDGVGLFPVVGLMSTPEKVPLDSLSEE